MDTEVDVSNPTLVLVPGMYAEVNLTLAQRNAVLAVPITAVDVDSTDPKAGGVMVVTHNNRIEPRTIQLGLETANRVEVRSGLNEGDMVVIGSRSGLQPGVEVRPKVTTIGAGSE
jgi:multidrug efflux pump subunit AcrA (membrane-fusion protein)